MKKSCYRTIYVALVFCFLFTESLLSAQETVTLEQCIEKALESNYSIKISRIQEKVAGNNLNYSPFLPTLGVSAGQKENINDTKTITSGEDKMTNNSRSDALTAGVALNWRLFDGMGMFVTQTKYQEMQVIGELNTQMAIENLIVSVSSSYYNVIMQHSKLDAARHSLGLSTERYKEAKDKYMLGVLSGLEAQQAKLDLNADSSNFMKQKELLKSAYITLNLSMNADLQQAMYVKDSITLREPLALQTLNDKMLQLNTTLLIGRRDLKISELDMKLARSVLLPTLDFSSGYNYSRTKQPAAVTSLNRTNGAYWGFSVNVDVFNRLEKRKNIKNARLDMENTDLSYQEAELQLRADLAQLYNIYENNLQIVSFEKESAEVAFDNLDAAIEKYKLGTLSGIEFREFQRSYIDAVDREVTAAYQAKVSELSLLLISGELKVEN